MVSLFLFCKGRDAGERRGTVLFFADYLAGVVYGKNKNFFQSEGK